MEFDGIKISSTNQPQKDSSVQSQEQSKENKNEQELDPMDYMVDGTSADKEILNKIKKIRVQEESEVVYGVYNNSEKGFFERVNDFFIDRTKIRLKDKSYFFHMLAVMVDAGIPIVAAVKSLAFRTENLHFQRVLHTVAYNCEHGAKLSESMSRFEEVFDEAEIGIVRSGEESGKLDSMLFKLSQELDKKHDLYMKLWGAAVYPIAVLSVLILVAVGMLVWVFPTLLNLLKEGGVAEESLPSSTKVLIAFQGALVNYWWGILIAVFALYGLFQVYVNSDYGATSWDYRKLRLPIIGTLLRKLSVLRFVGSVGLLIDSGLPVIKALKITGDSLKNRLYKMKVQEVIDSVRSGGKISQSLSDSEFLFPPEVVQMLNVGEKSASLGQVSSKVADQYQREIDNSLKKLMSVFEPVMILFVGLFVALLALAIMAPIFNLSSTAGL